MRHGSKLFYCDLSLIFISLLKVPVHKNVPTCSACIVSALDGPLFGCLSIALRFMPALPSSRARLSRAHARRQPCRGAVPPGASVHRGAGSGMASSFGGGGLIFWGEIPWSGVPVASRPFFLSGRTQPHSPFVPSATSLHVDLQSVGNILQK